MMNIASSAGERTRSQYPSAPSPVMPGARVWHKWNEILPALRMARESLCLNKGRLDLLEALLACVKGDRITVDRAGELIVHASNARLAEMTNRASEQSITRLITELERGAFVRRKTSPNGKRYCRRSQGMTTAYGIDIAPLIHAMPEILDRAADAEAERELCHQHRERISLMLQQIEPTIPFEITDEARKLLRRKANLGDLRAMIEVLETHSEDYRSSDSRRNDTQIACHKEPEQNQIKTISETEVAANLHRASKLLAEVNGDIRQAVQLAIRALGITNTLWQTALDKIGPTESTLAVLGLYERREEIIRPSSYLRSLFKHGKRPGTMLIRSIIASGRSMATPPGPSFSQARFCSANVS